MFESTIHPPGKPHTHPKSPTTSSWCISLNQNTKFLGDTWVGRNLPGCVRGNEHHSSWFPPLSALSIVWEPSINRLRPQPSPPAGRACHAVPWMCVNDLQGDVRGREVTFPVTSTPKKGIVWCENERGDKLKISFVSKVFGCVRMAGSLPRSLGHWSDRDRRNLSKKNIKVLVERRYR